MNSDPTAERLAVFPRSPQLPDPEQRIVFPIPANHEERSFGDVLESRKCAPDVIVVDVGSSLWPADSVEAAGAIIIRQALPPNGQQRAGPPRARPPSGQHLSRR